MEITTRLAEGRDYEAALVVWREANVARDRSPTAARERRIQEKLADPKASVLVAALKGREVVGMLLAEPGLADGLLPVADLGHISMVFVQSRSWRTGAGSSLLTAVEPVARTRGWQRLSLWTRESNIPAQRLYEKVGFARTGATKPLSENDLIGRWERRLPLGDSSSEGPGTPTTR